MQDRHKKLAIDSEADLIEMTDEQIEDQTSVFSFNLRDCSKRLERNDNWASIIHAHLFLDHILNCMLMEELKQPNQLNLDRIVFAGKIDLIAALGLIDASTKGFLKKLNSLRNAISHDLNFIVTSKHTHELSIICAPELRAFADDLYRTRKGKMTKLHAILLMNLATLDKQRQQHLKQRLIKRKREIELVNAFKALKREKT